VRGISIYRGRAHGEVFGGVRGTITIPVELRILAETVDRLDGPGLGSYRSKYQATLWLGLSEYQRPDCYVARVKNGAELRFDYSP
jgi:hypothetical protein